MLMWRSIMDDKKIILILVIVILVLACLISAFLLNSPKEVGEDYINFPTPNEKVRFTGTYLGPYDGVYNLDGQSGVIQVGNSYVIVATSKLQGLEGQTVTVEGCFLNDDIDKETVQINGGFVSGESFRIENVIR